LNNFFIDSICFLFYCVHMDCALAIERNRQPLLRIVAALFAMIGLGEGTMVERLSWPLYRAVLRVLRPAESAVRRLIVVAARDIVVKPRQARPAKAGLKIIRKGQGKGRKSFQLFDPRQRFDRPYGRTTKIVRAEPRIRILDFDPRSPLFLRQAQAAASAPKRRPGPRRAPDGTVSAGPLCRRLAAIKRALEDLASQARRYARWRARPLERRRPKLTSTLRPGPPPGFRKKPSHEVDAILHECDWLACAVPQPDTS
jgi:hypothetical protein